MQTSEAEQPQILIIKGALNIHQPIRKTLESMCYSIIESDNTQSIFDYLVQHQIDLILFALPTHGLSAKDTCRAVRSHSIFSNIPILLLVNSTAIELVKESYDAGATDFIISSSPIDFIAQRVRYALRNCRRELATRESEKLLSQAQKVAKMGYWRLDIAEQKINFSDGALKIFKLSDDNFTFSLKTYLDLVHLNDRDLVRTAIEKAIYDKYPFNLDHRIVSVAGDESYVHAQGEVIYDQNNHAISMFGTVQDITVRKRAEVTNEHNALYDSLTDLSNRRLFQNRLAHAMNEAHRHEKLLALCFFDLDNFKSINDNLGHAVGDELLKAVAKRLKGTMRQDDLIARISGDEFALAIEGLANISELEKILEKLRNKMSEPYSIRGHKILATASIGVALYPMDSANRETMMRYADAAMYNAKKMGGNCYCYYAHSMSDTSRRRLEIEIRLRDALALKELCVYYQPQFELNTQKIVGMEALIRWRHPEYGLLPPSKFISIAEETGLIFSIGEWVLETACQQMSKWHKTGYPNLRVAVNLSPRQFAQEGLVDRVESIIRKIKYNPKHLTLEVNESIAMQNNSITYDTLNCLKATGINLTLDNVGSGQLSMNQLQKLPIDTINIDRSSIMKIAGRERDGTTAKAIMALAHSMGFQVLAEGVETKFQVEFLAENKCDTMQGNFFSPPLPAEQVPRFLDKCQIKLDIPIAGGI